MKIWKQLFDFSTIWIRLLGLHLELWTPKLVSRFVSPIGTPLIADQAIYRNQDLTMLECWSSFMTALTSKNLSMLRYQIVYKYKGCYMNGTLPPVQSVIDGGTGRSTVILIILASGELLTTRRIKKRKKNPNPSLCRRKLLLNKYNKVFEGLKEKVKER